MAKLSHNTPIRYKSQTAFELKRKKILEEILEVQYIILANFSLFQHITSDAEAEELPSEFKIHSEIQGLVILRVMPLCFPACSAGSDRRAREKTSC